MKTLSLPLCFAFLCACGDDPVATRDTVDTTDTQTDTSVEDTPEVQVDTDTSSDTRVDSDTTVEDTTLDIQADSQVDAVEDSTAADIADTSVAPNDTIADTQLDTADTADTQVDTADTADTPVDTADTADTQVDTADTTPERTTILPGFCPSTPTGPGLYRGTLGGNLNDIAGACGLSAPGRDGAIRVELQPGQTVTATYRHAGDGVLYLLDSCPVVGSCLAGSDAGTGQESLTWTHTGSSVNPVYVVLDSFELGGPQTFELDLVVTGP